MSWITSARRCIACCIADGRLAACSRRRQRCLLVAVADADSDAVAFAVSDSVSFAFPFAVSTSVPSGGCYPPRRVPLLDVILGYDCNLACDYCTITPAMRQRALTSEDVVRELRAGRGAGFEAVSFTGGEPTIRRDLLGLVRAARQLGYTSIKVQSNGLLFAQASNLARLVDAGVTLLHVSIHTHDAGLYDALVRRDDSYALMVAGLRNAVATGLEVVADVILKSDTYGALPDALRWLHGLGVRASHLWFVSLTDGNRDNVASMPRMVEVLPALHEALAFARAHAMDVRSLHIPRCLLGDDHAHAWDPGSGRVRVVTPEATFELSESKLAGSVHVAACEGCTFRSVCPGVRTDYIERYGDAEIAEARGQRAQLPGVVRLPLM
jgi:MoaA/NifB/PqqE/SkfB family radical SAM enzyme